MIGTEGTCHRNEFRSDCIDVFEASHHLAYQSVLKLCKRVNRSAKIRFGHGRENKIPSGLVPGVTVVEVVVVDVVVVDVTEWRKKMQCSDYYIRKYLLIVIAGWCRGNEIRSDRFGSRQLDRGLFGGIVPDCLAWRVRYACYHAC